LLHLAEHGKQILRIAPFRIAWPAVLVVRVAHWPPVRRSERRQKPRVSDEVDRHILPLRARDGLCERHLAAAVLARADDKHYLAAVFPRSQEIDALSHRLDGAATGTMRPHVPKNPLSGGLHVELEVHDVAVADD